MTYIGTIFEIARSNGLEGNTFTRNVMDGRTDGRGPTLVRNQYTLFFSKEKAGITIYTSSDHGLNTLSFKGIRVKL